ncbi:hypothetical protein IHE45_05G142300 [Dioscorea alata]|uniref:Uncharacterized protein n=2 Tax=Dioscorea alata TaxID=55571 RepID=A0ACB7W597_DIOAL|nr:hypothetical protein IHE45_05G142300 [Dioscorea alata]KAH7682761.1 hypothetical protein IHE45_05G142300 [Dioscorea alata]
MEVSVRLLTFAVSPRPLLRLPRRPHISAPRRTLPSLVLPRNPNPRYGPFPFRTISPFLSISTSPPLTDSSAVSSAPSLTINGGHEEITGFRAELGEAWMVVLLGWLGAETKHLKRYAELYERKGIAAVRFVVPVKETLGFDLGRRVEEKVGRLSNELVDWCLDVERSGKVPRLIFHTFSNTGWLAYGEILNNLQLRNDILQKIKGCIFDSGAAPEIDPQIWAAGFSAALLKKQSSSAYVSAESTEGKFDGDTNKSRVQQNRPNLCETTLLSILEKFFAIILKLPSVNKRLTKVISILSEKQPFCPQLYLYSSSDKIISGAFPIYILPKLMNF